MSEREEEEIYKFLLENLENASTICRLCLNQENIERRITLDDFAFMDEICNAAPIREDFDHICVLCNYFMTEVSEFKSMAIKNEEIIQLVHAATTTVDLSAIFDSPADTNQGYNTNSLDSNQNQVYEQIKTANYSDISGSPKEMDEGTDDASSSTTEESDHIVDLTNEESTDPPTASEVDDVDDHDNDGDDNDHDDDHGNADEDDDADDDDDNDNNDDDDEYDEYEYRYNFLIENQGTKICRLCLNKEHIKRSINIDDFASMTRLYNAAPISEDFDHICEDCVYFMSEVSKFKSMVNEHEKIIQRVHAATTTVDLSAIMDNPAGTNQGNNANTLDSNQNQSYRQIKTAKYSDISDSGEASDESESTDDQNPSETESSENSAEESDHVMDVDSTDSPTAYPAD